MTIQKLRDELNALIGDGYGETPVVLSLTELADIEQPQLSDDPAGDFGILMRNMMLAKWDADGILYDIEDTVAENEPVVLELW